VSPYAGRGRTLRHHGDTSGVIQDRTKTAMIRFRGNDRSDFEWRCLPANLPKIPDKTTVMEFWEPRLGKRAAFHIYRANKISALIPWMGLGYFAVFFTAGRLHVEYGGQLALVVGTITMGYVLSSFVSTWLWRRAASASLGFKITGKNRPPARRDLYLAWCQAHDVIPFSQGSDSET
jgi:hypothetical protein